MSELYVHVRLENKVNTLNFLLTCTLSFSSSCLLLSLHIISSINLCMLNFAWHTWYLNSNYVRTTLSKQFSSVCCLAVRDTSVLAYYDKSSKMLTHSCNNVAIVSLL